MIRSLIALLTILLSSSVDAAVRGTVISREGQPVEGAIVTAFALETDAAFASRIVQGRERIPVATAKSDAKGEFELDVPPGASIDLVTSANGFAPEGVWIIADETRQTLVLGAVERVKGRVSAAGKAVAGAKVIWRGDTTEVSTVSGDDGTFEIPDPSQWANEALVFHPSYAPRKLNRMESGGAFDRNLQLDAGKEIRGVITREREPVAGAQISIDGFPFAISNADGTFVITHAPLNTTEIHVKTMTHSASARVTAKPVAIDLAPGATLSGAVRDEKGRALPGSRVLVSGGSTRETAITDSKGAFEIRNLPREQFWIQALRPGFHLAAEESEEAYEPIDLKSALTLRRDLVLAPVTRVHGRVVTEEGKPVAAAWVTSSTPSSPLLYGVLAYQPGAFSRPDGTFDLELPGRYEGAEEDSHLLYAYRSGWAVASVDLSEPLLSGAREAIIRLPKGVAVAGVVVDADDKPVANATVAVVSRPEQTVQRWPLESLFTRIVRAELPRTGADGRFILNVNPGTHDVAARADATKVTSLNGVKLDGKEPLIIRLEAGHSIKGKVVSSSGVPVAGASIRLMSPTWADSLTTDASGTFRFTGLGTGGYQLMVAKPDEKIFERRGVSAPSDEIVITLAPRFSLRGQVRSASDGMPVTRFSVETSIEESLGGGMNFMPHHGRPEEETESEDGSFTVDGLTPGRYSLRIRAKGYAQASASATIPESGEVPAVEIEMTPGSRFRGRVQDESEHAIEEVSVTIRGSDYRTAESAMTDVKGEFELTTVSNGNWEISFEKKGFAPKDAPVTVSEENGVQTFTLERAATLKGIVVAASGEPLDGAYVEASSESDDANDFAQSGEDGTFELSSLPKGKYRLTVSSTGYEKAELSSVAAGTDKVTRVVLRKAPTATITGKVRGGDSDALMTTVTATTDVGSADARVEGNGEYRIEEAPAGVVTVRVQVMSRSDSRSLTRVVDVAPGSEARVDFDLDDVRVVRGRVTLEGAPLLNAQLNFQSEGSASVSTGTGAEGAYEVRLPADGRYDVYVRAYELGGASFTKSHQVFGSGTFDIDIRKRRIAGKVIDARSGDALAGVKLTMVSIERQGNHEEEATADADGRFALTTTEDGALRLRATREGYGQAFTDIQSESVSDMTIQLAPSEGLTVRLVDAMTGRTLDGIIVVRDGEGRYAFNGSSNARSDGAIRIPLAPGAYKLSASSTDYATQSLPVTVPSSEVRLGLTRGGSITIVSASNANRTGKLVMPNGDEYIRCECNGIAELKITGRRTRVEHVAAGHYQLQVFSDGAVRAYPVVVSEGGVAEVTIE